MNKYNEFASDEGPLDGDKIRLDDILNKELVIKGHRLGRSKYEGKGDYVTIQVEMDDRLRVIFTGSRVLMSQCEKHKDMMPFVATIKKVDKYYTFS